MCIQLPRYHPRIVRLHRNFITIDEHLSSVRYNDYDIVFNEGELYEPKRAGGKDN
jgi:hypothetical protein